MAGPDFAGIFGNEENPLINPQNYFEGYNEQIQKLKNNPQALSFDKMCYELFEHTELGQKFMEYILIHKILKPASDQNNPMLQIHAVWAEGFKAFYYMIMNAVTSHKQRIHAEVNKPAVEVKANAG